MVAWRRPSPMSRSRRCGDAPAAGIAPAMTPPRRRWSFGRALDGFFFVFAGLAAFWLAYLSFTESFSLGWAASRWRSPSGCCSPISCCRGCIASSPPSTSRLLHGAYAHVRRAVGRPRQPGFPGRTGADRGRAGGRRLDRRRSGHPALLVADHQLDPATAQLSPCAGEPAVPLRARAGSRVSAGGRRIPRAAAPRAPVAMPRRMAPPGWTPRRLAGRRHLRSRGRPLAVHAAGDPPDRCRHRHREGPHRGQRRRGPGVEVDVIRDFSTGYHSRNGGGDSITTDGDLPIIDVRAVSAVGGERTP